MSTTATTTTAAQADDARAQALQRAAATERGPGAEGLLGFLTRYYRHVPDEDLLARDPVDLAGAALSHRQLAQERVSGTAVVRVHTPSVDSHGWQTGTGTGVGHTVVEVVAEDMPFLVDSVTNRLNARDSGMDRTIHLVVHPIVVVRRDVTGALRRGARHLDRQARLRRARRGLARRRRQRVVDAPGDRPRAGRRRVRAAARRAGRGARRRAHRGRGLAEDAGPGGRGGRRARHRGAVRPGRRGRRGPAADALAGERELHLPRLPRVRAHRRPGAGVAHRRHRQRAGHPALRPDPGVAQLRAALAAGAREGARAAGPGAHEGELARDRAPQLLPRLRRRQGVRRRPGGGRASFPRPVHLSGVHRERAAGADRRHHRRRRPGRGRPVAVEPLGQGPARDPGDLPARRAVPDRPLRGVPDGDGGAAPAGAATHPAVPAHRRLRPLRLGAGVPAARPLQHLGPAADAGDPVRGVRRRVGRLHHPRQRVGARPAALRAAAAEGRRHPRGRREGARGAAGGGHPHLGGGPRRRPRPRGGGGRGRPPGALVGRRLPRVVQGGLRRARGGGRPAPDRGGRPRGRAHDEPAGDQPLRAGRRRPGRTPAQAVPQRAALAHHGAAVLPQPRRRGGRRASVRDRRARRLERVRVRLRPALPGHVALLGDPGDAHRRPVRGVVRADRVRRPRPARHRRRPHVAADRRPAHLRQVPAPDRVDLQPGVRRAVPARERRDRPAPGRAVRGALRPRPRRRAGRAARDRRRARGGDHPRPRGRGEPRPGPDPALAARDDPGDGAHQLLPGRRRRSAQGARRRQARPQAGARPAQTASGA